MPHACVVPFASVVSHACAMQWVQAKMQMVCKNFAGIVKTLEKSLASNNLEKASAGHMCTHIYVCDGSNAKECSQSAVINLSLGMGNSWAAKLDAPHSGHMRPVHPCVATKDTRVRELVQPQAPIILIRLLSLVLQVAGTMSEFEKQFENLDLQTSVRMVMDTCVGNLTFCICIIAIQCQCTLESAIPHATMYICHYGCWAGLRLEATWSNST